MKIDEAVSKLIEKLRSVKWEVIDDDDWDSRCVFVDMRPDDFEALLTEAAAALEEARDDACVALQPELVEYIRGLALDAARYRWLRDPCSGAERVVLYSRGDFGRVLMSHTILDAAIDAAMQRTTSREGGQ